MDKANRFALIGYCDKLGLGNRLLLGVRSPCEHRRLPDPLSRYLLKTRPSTWMQPDDIEIVKETTTLTENLLAGDEEGALNPENDSISREATREVTYVRSQLSWEARPINLLEAKYEPFTLFIANTLLTSSESVSIIPALYNYLVKNSVSKIIVISALDVRPIDLVPVAPLTVGEHQLRGQFGNATGMGSAVASSAASSTSGAYPRPILCEVLYNDCPSFGFQGINPGDWLSADPFLSIITQLLTVSHIPGAILGTFNYIRDDDIDSEKNWARISNSIWKLASTLQQNFGISFDMDVIEYMKYVAPLEGSIKQKIAAYL